MKEATPDADYQLLDSGNLQKLESINGYKLIRPASVAIWAPRLSSEEWAQASSRFERDSAGGGRWMETGSQIESQWRIKIAGFQMDLKKTNFGHLGIFPEQLANWQNLIQIVKKMRVPNKEFKVLNLFAYTGGATLACASAGAAVTHLDASKVSVGWAKQNAAISEFSEAPIRWIVDDVVKFVAKEVKRGVIYDGVILDPPTYGRGPKNQMWKIERDLRGLVQMIAKLLNSKTCFVLLSSHSQGHSPLALKNILGELAFGKWATYQTSEMTVKENGKLERFLPSGSSCLIHKNSELQDI